MAATTTEQNRKRKRAAVVLGGAALALLLLWAGRGRGPGRGGPGSGGPGSGGPGGGSDRGSGNADALALPAPKEVILWLRSGDRLELGGVATSLETALVRARAVGRATVYATGDARVGWIGKVLNELKAAQVSVGASADLWRAADYVEAHATATSLRPIEPRNAARRRSTLPRIVDVEAQTPAGYRWLRMNARGATVTPEGFAVTDEHEWAQSLAAAGAIEIKSEPRNAARRSALRAGTTHRASGANPSVPSEPVVLVREGTGWRQYFVISDERVAVVHMKPAYLGGWRFDHVDVQGEDDWPGMKRDAIVAWKFQSDDGLTRVAEDLGDFRERLLEVARVAAVAVGAQQ